MKSYYLKSALVIVLALAVFAASAISGPFTLTAYGSSYSYSCVTKEKLNVRTGPSTSYKSLGTIAKGKSFTSTGYKKTSGVKWYKTTYSGKTGYICGSYVKVKSYRCTYSTSKKIRVSEDSVNIRAGAGVSYKKLATVSKGTAFTAKGFTKNTLGETWYRFSYNGTTAYVRKDLVEIVSSDGDDSGSDSGGDSGGDGTGSTSDGDSSTNTESTESDSEQSDSEAFEKYMTAQGFPDSYKPYLRALHKAHPKWVFKAQKTGLAWSTVVSKETVVGRSLVYSSAPSAWKSMQKGAYNWTSGTYVSYDSGLVTAHSSLVKYYLDPRNFLNESQIYQFISHSYDSSQTLTTVKAVTKGTFLADSYCKTYATYADAVYAAGKKAGVNPNVLASMIIQEQGTNGVGRSISGTVSGFKGYYNYLNIGAYSSGGMTAVEHGLWWAKGAGVGATSYSRPWTTRYKAIYGGALYYADNYVKDGQNTLYLKKWNVMNGASSLATHQYMTNVDGAYNEAVFLRKAYSNQTSAALVFYIPVYTNMPATACSKPGTTGANNNFLKAIKVKNGSTVYTLSPGFARYTKSYKVTVPAKVDKVTVTATRSSSKATIISGTGQVELATGTNTVKIKVKSSSGRYRTYTLVITRKSS